MTLQMPPDLLHYAEAATVPSASRREVRTSLQNCTPFSLTLLSLLA